ncbi:hypothetical protein THAOC_18291, partial [Thalassiosira oceanica]
MRSTGSASDMIDLRSVRSARQGSVRSVGSRESHSTPQVSNRVRSDASLSSHRSGSSSRHSAGRATFDDAVRHLDRGRHARAVRDLTTLIARARPDDADDLARLHGLRSEGLLALGACEAATADARRALDHERAGGVRAQSPNEGVRRGALRRPAGGARRRVRGRAPRQGDVRPRPVPPGTGRLARPRGHVRRGVRPVPSPPRGGRRRVRREQATRTGRGGPRAGP